MKEQILALLLAASFSLTGCGNGAEKKVENNTEASQGTEVNQGTEKNQGTEENKSTEVQSEVSDVTLDGSCAQLAPLEKGEQIAVLSTNYGDIKVRFLPKYAPKAVENFVTHAKEGYYDGLTFHRVIEDFMIQGGDPEGTGMGGESIWGEPFGVEASEEVMHLRGALCMAKSAAPISIGSQFYIVHNNKLQPELKQQIDEAVAQGGYNKTTADLYEKWGGTPFLDSQYTVFGQVIEGMSVVDKIAKVEKDANDKPVSDVIINKITVEQY